MAKLFDLFHKFKLAVTKFKAITSNIVNVPAIPNRPLKTSINICHYTNCEKNAGSSHLIGNVYGLLRPSNKFYINYAKQNNVMSLFKQIRFYADDCNLKNAKPCPKIKLDNCPPPHWRKRKCRKVPVVCKKQEAPYPSFSESCYMEPEKTFTECDMCPWSVKNNPNYKGQVKMPQRRRFHTSSRDMNGCGTNCGKDILTDYPRKCVRKTDKAGKVCPNGLTKIPTRKERLKKKPPREQTIKQLPHKD